MNPEQKKQAIIMGVLGVVLVGVVVFQVTRPPAGGAARAAAQAASASATPHPAAARKASTKTAGVEFKKSGIDLNALAASVVVLEFDSFGNLEEVSEP